MRIVETIPVSDHRSILICEHNGQFTVERHGCYTPDEVVSRHSSFEEASQAGRDELDRTLRVAKQIEPLLVILRPKFQAMGVEASIEYIDEVRRRIGKFVPEREVIDDIG